MKGLIKFPVSEPLNYVSFCVDPVVHLEPGSLQTAQPKALVRFLKISALIIIFTVTAQQDHRPSFN